MSDNKLKVGRVLRASTQGFVVGWRECRAYARVHERRSDHVLERLSLRPADKGQFVGADQRENRQVPIEVSVLAVGARQSAGSDGGNVRHCLPAQPPVTLDWLYRCTSEEMRAFTTRFDYFRLVLDARDVPADELLAASLRAAAAARPEEAQETFLVEAGRELARLLAGNPVRLEGLLRRLRA
jgi:hypothetical protein